MYIKCHKMPPINKRTLSVVLLSLASVIINKVQCQSKLEDNITLMSSLPAERLLRGSNDEDTKPIEAIMHSLNAQIQNEYKENPTLFFNAEESKSVRLTESDLVTDPVTGQTLIKHITDHNEETDYVMRPTDVALKNLQGFLVDDGQTTLDSNTEEIKDGTESTTAIKAVETEAAIVNEEVDGIKSSTTTEVTTKTGESAEEETDTGEIAAQAAESQTERKDVYEASDSSEEKLDQQTIKPQGAETTTEGVDVDGVNTSAKPPPRVPTDAAARALDQNKVSAVPLKRPDDAPKPRPSKRAALRSWLQEPWLRAPVALLAPLRAGSLERALAVWKEASAPALNLTDILLVGYDENGISWMSKHSLQSPGGVESVTNALIKLLQKYQGLPARQGGDAALHACARAARRLPYDSALFLVTDSPPADAHRLPAALRTIIEKRLKLYTIWTDPLYPSPTSERAVAEFKKASKNTEGEFLDYHPTITISSLTESVPEGMWARSRSPYGEHEYRTGRIEARQRNSYETLLVRRNNGGGPASLGLPIDTGVEALHVRIEGGIDRAALYPPTGLQIDLLNATAVSTFAPGSRVQSDSPLDVLLVFPTNNDSDNGHGAGEGARRPTVGLWRLSVRCAGCEYRVAVTVRARIGLDADMLSYNSLRLRARGPIASIRETALIDEYGTELAKLPFSHQPVANEEDGGAATPADADASSLVADVTLPSISRAAEVYAKILGRDVYGESFARVAGPIFKSDRAKRSAQVTFPEETAEEELQTLNQVVSFPETRDGAQRLVGYNETNVLTGSTTTAQILSQAGTLLTAVQIGLSSRLYGAPGDNLQLHFEVTNYRERTVSFRFEATGNLRFLRGIRPTAQWVNSGQTINVIVDVGITANAQVGARDLITFTATGLDQVSISAYVYVTNPEAPVYDVWAPIVRHTFQGDCILKLGDDCARHTWAATVYARDQDLGLLRLSSSPVGLRYESSFTSGTREEVLATYRATCCAPRLLVNAVDANGNANTYIVDITYYIPDAAIAAITLGVLFFIALVALTIFLVIVCLRRRKESRALPSYATSRRETS